MRPIDAEVHRPRCCDIPIPVATWGLGNGENNFITVSCDNCDADLITLDPVDHGTYVGPWINR